MGFYLLVTKKEVMKFAGSWVEPENTVLSKVALPHLSPGKKHHMLSLVWFLSLNL